MLDVISVSCILNTSRANKLLTKLRNRVMKATMKDKVVKLLIKWGNSEESVNRMIDTHFDYAVKTYPEAKPSFIADVVSTLS